MVTFIQVPFEDKEKVKRLGAHYFPSRKLWYFEETEDPAKLCLWNTIETMPLAEFLLEAVKAEDPDRYWFKQRIALAYRYGRDGLPRNMKEAFYWMKKAAEAGCGLAWSQLGHMYEHDDEIPEKDRKREAFCCYEKGARLHNADCESDLGRAYRDAIGTKRDLAKAYELFVSAKNKGNEWAEYFLANMFYYGSYVQEDIPAAKQIFERLAENAQNKLIQRKAKRCLSVYKRIG